MNLHFADRSNDLKAGPRARVPQTFGRQYHMVYWLIHIVNVATWGGTLDDFWALRAPLILGIFFYAVVYGCISVALQAMAKADRLVLCKRRVLPPAGL